MISVRPANGSRPLAVFVRLLAFVVAAASILVVPWTLAGAAAGHVTTEAAFTTAGVAVALSLLTSVAARSLDPLRH